jgi:hypothetical protein
MRFFRIIPEKGIDLARKLTCSVAVIIEMKFKCSGIIYCYPSHVQGISFSKLIVWEYVVKLLLLWLTTPALLGALLAAFVALTWD